MRAGKSRRSAAPHLPGYYHTALIELTSYGHLYTLTHLTLALCTRTGYTVFAGELNYGGGDPECGYKVCTHWAGAVTLGSK